MDLDHFHWAIANNMSSWVRRAILKVVFGARVTQMILTKANLVAGGDRQDRELQEHREIGAGQCGVVYSLPASPHTLKVMRPGKGDQLYNNFIRHYEVRKAFENLPLAFKTDLDIPQLGPWLALEGSEAFGETYLQHLPDQTESIYGFISERIYPLPLPIREALVDQFAPRCVRKVKPLFMALHENKDCLVRLYLGRRGLPRSTFHLRNFDLMVDEMEKLCLDTSQYAEIMARTLAVLHWKVKIDGNDIEFVLGRSSPNRLLPTLEEYRQVTIDGAATLGSEPSYNGSVLGVWLLDFDQCQGFEENESGLKQLERAFIFNDPYYPRPGARDEADQQLWFTFKRVYLEISTKLTASKMPAAFIKLLEDSEAQRISPASLF